MNAVQMYPAIAAATFTMGVWVAVAYHFDRNSTPGEERWYYLVWMVLPVVLAGWYFAKNGFDAPILTGPGVYVTAVCGIGFGVLPLYMLKALIAREYDDVKQRRHQMFAAIFFCLLFFGGTFFL